MKSTNKGRRVRVTTFANLMEGDFKYPPNSSALIHYEVTISVLCMYIHHTEGSPAYQTIPILVCSIIIIIHQSFLRRLTLRVANVRQPRTTVEFAVDSLDLACRVDCESVDAFHLVDL